MRPPLRAKAAKSPGALAPEDKASRPMISRFGVAAPFHGVVLYPSAVNMRVVRPCGSNTATVPPRGARRGQKRTAKESLCERGPIFAVRVIVPLLLVVTAGALKVMGMNRFFATPILPLRVPLPSTLLPT